MTQNYYTIVTDAGLAKQLNCIANKTNFDIAQIAVGDGNGSLYEPSVEQTALKNQKWIGNVLDSGVVDGKLYATANLPSDIGGFIIREIGLFDSEGTLICIGKTPETAKILGDNGGLQEIYVKILMKLTNSDLESLIVQTNVNMATTDYVTNSFATKNLDNLTPAGQTKFDAKQDSLTAGDNVVINNNIISANLNAKYSVNRGNTNSSGDADLIDAVATTVVTDSTETTQTVTKTVNTQYTTPGVYTFNAPVDGYYLVDVVGGGGTGGSGLNSYAVGAYWSGGSGSAFSGQVYLTAGNHTITVGGVNGASSIDGLIVAGGGGNGSGGAYNLQPTGGAGGTLSVTGQVQNTTIYSNGNAGTGVTGGFSHIPGGASLYNGWGAGAGSNGSPATGVVTLYRQWQETITTGGTSETVIAGSTTVNYKIGGSYPVLVGTNVKGEQFSITGLNSDDTNELADGTYIKYVGSDGSSELLNAPIYTSSNLPSSVVTNSVCLDTRTEPLHVYKYNGSSWIEYDKVPIGRFTVSNGTISSYQTFPYNQNGYNCNVYSNQPDFSRFFDVALPYTSYVDGWAFAEIYCSDTSGSHAKAILANGVPIASTALLSVQGVIFPIQKNVTYSTDSTSGNINTFRVYPAKGGF